MRSEITRSFRGPFLLIVRTGQIFTRDLLEYRRMLGVSSI
jgi:hypothetical protein